ncbi:MAG: hypothetical protein ISR76_02755 [Planctomycetes bacterium]|nr:hypothetical protein [Planctomycetota bacterium]
MLLLQVIPAFLSLLALAAHFLRGGHLFLAGVVVGAVALLTVRRRWAGWLLQGILALGALVWLLQAWVLAQLRAERGEPYGRMLVILGAVAAVCVLSALLLRRRRARAWFQPDDRPQPGT